jgi:PEP-CTERM motif-containing protein
MRARKHGSVVTAVVFAVVFANSSYAGPIGSRAELRALLGGPGTLEDFEKFSMGGAGVVQIDCDPLSSTAICLGQGPGLIVPGLSITGKPLYWYGKGHGPHDSQSLAGSYHPEDYYFDFTGSVQAFGADLWDFFRMPWFATLTIYGTDDTTVIGKVTVPGCCYYPTFAGWYDPAGIGGFKGSLDRAEPSLPTIDDLEFGVTSVPEPASLTLLAVGLVFVALRKRS